jgi:hypothetical protein
MAYTNIDLPTDYFNTKLYTGNDTDDHAITGVGFQPDFVWIKSRSVANNHNLYDVIRGVNKPLKCNNTASEFTRTDALKSFDSDGFTLDDDATSDEVNNNAVTFASWNWLANGTGVSNTSGTISSTVSANTTSGFSIVSYTGNGSNGATIGHGLGVSPKMVIVKSRSNTGDWAVYHASLTAGNMVFLNTTGASGTISGFDNGGINPVSSTTFTTAQGGVSQNNVNTSGRTYIAYCFADVKGYSKFGSYTGNGNADGTFVYTGFKPAFVLLKSSSNSGWHWRLSDNKRDNFNSANNKNLFPSSSDAEVTSEKDVDFLSNGFKLRTNDNGVNTSGWTIIYMAFAENPFVSSKGIPTTAR